MNFQKIECLLFCQNKKVEEYLKKRNFKFISIYNPLKLILSFGARVIIDGGSIILIF